MLSCKKIPKKGGRPCVRWPNNDGSQNQKRIKAKKRRKSPIARKNKTRVSQKENDKVTLVEIAIFRAELNTSENMRKSNIVADKASRESKLEAPSLSRDGSDTKR